jgi:hypothetical protein
MPNTIANTDEAQVRRFQATSTEEPVIRLNQPGVLNGAILDRAIPIKIANNKQQSSVVIRSLFTMSRLYEDGD